MTIIKEENSVILKDDTKNVLFTFARNLDFYISLHSTNTTTDNCFTITKENYQLYSVFELLLNDIKEINLFSEIKIPNYIDNNEEKDEYIKYRLEDIEEDKNSYRRLNNAHYNEK